MLLEEFGSSLDEVNKVSVSSNVRYYVARRKEQHCSITRTSSGSGSETLYR